MGNEQKAVKRRAVLMELTKAWETNRKKLAEQALENVYEGKDNTELHRLLLISDAEQVSLKALALELLDADLDSGSGTRGHLDYLHSLMVIVQAGDLSEDCNAAFRDFRCPPMVKYCVETEGTPEVLRRILQAARFSARNSLKKFETAAYSLDPKVPEQQPKQQPKQQPEPKTPKTPKEPKDLKDPQGPNARNWR